MFELKMRNLILIVCFLLLLVAPSGVSAEDSGLPDSLRVTYLEFPPYYFTNLDGKPDGFLLKKTDKLLRAAGIEPVYESLTAKNVLMELKGLNPVCSIGWFKTPQREKFAQFSTPIYRNLPLHILYLKQNVRNFRGKQSLKDFLEDENLTIGLADGYSYGPAVDEMFAQSKPKTFVVTGEQPQLVRSLAAGEFDYMLAAPEEIRTLVEKNRLSAELFGSLKLADIPAGNERHLMFSRGVPGVVVERINKANSEL